MEFPYKLVKYTANIFPYHLIQELVTNVQSAPQAHTQIKVPFHGLTFEVHMRTHHYQPYYISSNSGSVLKTFNVIHRHAQINVSFRDPIFKLKTPTNHQQLFTPKELLNADAEPV